MIKLRRRPGVGRPRKLPPSARPGWAGALIVAALAVPASAPAQQAGGDGNEAGLQFTAPLQPGDALRLTFWRERELDGEFPVDERGVAVLPILGPMEVAGRPAVTLKEQIIAAYDEHLRNQDVQVVLLRRISVVGAVGAPGIYYVDPTMTLGDALARAGGVSTNGRLEDTRLIRDGRRAATELRETYYLNELRSGDQIYVPERSWISRNSTTVVAGFLSLTGLFLSAVLLN